MSRRRPCVARAAQLLGAAAVPLVAFFIVPQFARSTLVEDLPDAPAFASTTAGGSAATSAGPSAGIATLLMGRPVSISAADYGSGTIRIVRVGDTRVVRFEGVDIAGAPDV